MEAVHDSLGRLDGVHFVAIDLQSNRVTITPATDTILDLAEVVEAIRRAGFRPGHMSVRAIASLETPPGGQFIRFRGWPSAFPWDGPPLDHSLDAPLEAAVDYSHTPPRLAPEP